jgi:hypothetical protein
MNFNDLDEISICSCMWRISLILKKINRDIDRNLFPSQFILILIVLIKKKNAKQCPRALVKLINKKG